MRRVYRQSLHSLNYTSAKWLGAVEVLLTGGQHTRAQQRPRCNASSVGRLLFLYIDGGKGEERRKRLPLVLFEEIDFTSLLDQEKCLVWFFWMLVLIIRRKGRGGDCPIFLYTHGSAIDGDRKVGKRPEVNCSAGVTILRLLQDYFSFAR